MKKTLYILRGAPASGKTTLSPELAKSLVQPVALLEQDNWRWGIHLTGRTVPDVTQQEHTFADEIFLYTLEQYLKTKQYNIVVEGTFNWNNPEFTNITVQTLIDLAKKYNYDVKNIVLKANKQKLLDRNAARKYSVPKEEFNTLYKSVYSYIDESEYLIDSTKLNKKETLQILRSALY